MDVKVIRTEIDYKAALKHLETLFDAAIGTKQSDDADVLALLIDAYETEMFPITAPDPIEAIKIRMEELNLKQTDLVNQIGTKSRVSEILNKKRKLTVTMIRNLTLKLNLPPSLLLLDYQIN